MIIQPNWTVSGQGPWQLIYNDEQIISLLEVQGVTSTQGKLFVGTRTECEAEIERLGLPWPQVEETGPDPELPPVPPGIYDNLFEQNPDGVDQEIS